MSLCVFFFSIAGRTFQTNVGVESPKFMWHQKREHDFCRTGRARVSDLSNERYGAKADDRDFTMKGGDG